MVSMYFHLAQLSQKLSFFDRMFSPCSLSCQAYKYVPYGPVKEVIPYLIRRAQENSNLLGGAVKERQLFLAEFIRRLRLLQFGAVALLSYGLSKVVL